jgi:hypothetical protein
MLLYCMAISYICGHFVYFIVIWYTLWSFGIYCYGHLVYFVAIWNISWLFGIFSCFGMLHQEKSGNPAL